MRRKAIIGVAITSFLAALILGGFAILGFISSDDLNAAARSGDLSACIELVSNGADVNGKGMHAMTPIMSAAEGGNPAVVNYLIANGADVNSHNDSGSALMWAIESENEEIVKTLLLHGANSHWRNHLGETALDHATAKGIESISRLLR